MEQHRPRYREAGHNGKELLITRLRVCHLPGSAICRECWPKQETTVGQLKTLLM